MFHTIRNNSSLPCDFGYLTEKCLSAFLPEDMGKIINVNSKKAGGFDKISIHMLKRCGESVCALFASE